MFNNIALQLEDPLILLPMLICCMIPFIMRMFKKQGPSSAAATEMDTWFTSYGIKEAFEKVKNHVSKWKSRSKSEPTRQSQFSLFGGARAPPSERFVALDSVSPRLLKFSDPVEGNVAFEFTETEAGGTAIRVNYHPRLKDRLQKMRASFPLKIPLAAGTPCTACGKPVLPDFKVCPFCGQKTK